MQCRQTFSLVLFTQTGQYTSTETSRGNRTLTPVHTVQDKTSTLQTYTGRRNKSKDAGIRLTELKLKTHSLTRSLKSLNEQTRSVQKENSFKTLHALTIQAYTLNQKDHVPQCNQQRRPKESQRRDHSTTNLGEHKKQSKEKEKI